MQGFTPEWKTNFEREATTRDSKRGKSGNTVIRDPIILCTPLPFQNFWIRPCLYRCKFLLHVIHIYRTCFSYNEDGFREKQVFHQFLLKSYDWFCGQAEVSISVALGYHSCQTYIAKQYRKTPLVFYYYCRQKTIFYYSSALIQVVEAHISE